MSQEQNVYGEEGNHDASLKYDHATKKCAESGRAKQAARDATPKTSREVAEMEPAERGVLSPANEKKPPVKEPETPPPAADDPEPDPREPKEKERACPGVEIQADGESAAAEVIAI
jgi:hypothetical protein